MTNLVAVKAFLEYYLPDDLKNLVDWLKIVIKQESYNRGIFKIRNIVV
ncbi:prenyltransferase [Rickettsia oklahomensis]|uniref:Prenyltransferase n=1 Tax=Rickettsia oklahomensis TaxID=3141789 RepID=A0AAU7BZI9_9RICK